MISSFGYIRQWPSFGIQTLESEPSELELSELELSELENSLNRKSSELGPCTSESSKTSDLFFSQLITGDDGGR